MTRPAVIACSLDAAGAVERRREWRLLLERALVSRTPIAGGVRIELAALPGVRQELAHLVRGERACCPFLSIDVVPTDAVLVLDATAPAAGGAIVAELFDGDNG
jgi:hypothetical protein